jgi:hypothetical protein
MPPFLVRLLYLLLAVLLLAGPAHAEPTPPPGDEVKAVQLAYEARTGQPGRIASTRFTAAEGPVRFYVRGTDISAPLSVQVIAAATARPVKVSLHRHVWGSAEASGTTGAAGIYAFEGRAYGDVGVQLVSETGDPAAGTLVIWQGEPAPPDFSQVYAPLGAAGEAGRDTAAPRTPDSAGAAGSSPVFYLIAALLAAIAVMIGILMMRHGRSRQLALVLACGLGVMVLAPDGWAQSGTDKDPPKPGIPNPFDVEGPVPEVPRDKDKDATAGKPDEKPGEAPGKPGSAPPNPFDVPETADGAGQIDKDKSASAGRPQDAPKPGDETEGAPVDEGYADRLAEAEARIADLDRRASANRAEIERLRLLIESDADNEPDPDNVPPLEVSCRPGDLFDDRGMTNREAEDASEAFEACQKCYERPLADFEAQMLLYEKLRVLYRSTDSYVKKVIDTGDKAPKPHYLLENAWAAQKLDLRVTFAKTQQAYDAKLEEFNAKLTVTLDEIGDCETRFNNNPNWRRTTGLFFYQTMANSYKRGD